MKFVRVCADSEVKWKSDVKDFLYSSARLTLGKKNHKEKPQTNIKIPQNQTKPNKKTLNISL